MFCILLVLYEGNERFAECRRQCARVVSALQSVSSEWDLGFGIRVALSGATANLERPGGGGSFAGRFRLRCLVVCASVAAPARSPSVSLSLAIAGRCAESGGGCDSALGCAGAAAAATSVSVAAVMSGPASCTCGCARDWSVRCCVVSGCGFGRWCGRFRPASGGGSGGGRGCLRVARHLVGV